MLTEGQAGDIFDRVRKLSSADENSPTSKSACKHGGWKSFTNPSFKNQGQCVSYVAHHTQHGKSHKHTK